MSSPAKAALAFAVCLIIAPIVLWALRRGRLLDEPSARSSHQEATPRGGGLAPALGCLITIIVASGGLLGDSRIAIAFLATGMGLVGLIDDVYRLEPLPRLVAQMVVATAGLIWLGRDIQGPASWHVLFAAGIVLWVVGYVNAFNFMDGINGISVCQVVIAGITWWALAESRNLPELGDAGLIAAAAAAAFAPFNTPRATMFLGDVGSYFFGAWLATAAVIGLRGGIPPEAILAPLAVYGADTVATLVRRIARGQEWYRPHREHTYQRLVQAGWSHGRTSLVVAFAIAVTSGLGAFSLTRSLSLRVCGDVLIVATLATYVGLPNLLGHRSISGSDAALTS